MKKASRQSGIELLRILTIMGVVLLHYNDGKAFVYAQNSSNLYVLFFLESLCIGAVDLFILISGYFLAGTQKRSYIKPLELIFQTILFKEVYYLATALFGGATFSVGGFLYQLLPTSYFVVLYTVVYLLSPYLNRLFATFSSHQWKRFMVVCLLIFSVWPTCVDLLEELIGQDIIGLSTITFKGSFQGFTVVNFLLLYCVGAYLRFNDVPKFFAKRRTQVASIAVVTSLIFVWALATQTLTRTELRSAWVYHNPLVILLAALLFVLFRSFTFQSKVVNELAGASFMCFLTHGYLLPRVGIAQFATGNVFLMVAHIVAVMVGCYLVAYGVYKAYGLATGWFFKRAATWSVFQPREDV